MATQQLRTTDLGSWALLFRCCALPVAEAVASHVSCAEIRPGCSVPAGSHCLEQLTPQPRAHHLQPAGTQGVASWEDPARVMSEAIRLALEQVWPVERGRSRQSVDKGDRAGTREKLRCSERVRTHSCLPC